MLSSITGYDPTPSTRLCSITGRSITATILYEDVAVLFGVKLSWISLYFQYCPHQNTT